jgi:hypothetical protein
VRESDAKESNVAQLTMRNEKVIVNDSIGGADIFAQTLRCNTKNK